ncbi:MAG TPA: gephyrin-like molybdotransferase Glp [Dermatophilaceae bacterium]|nr:gephyrin-like molybdotransferase Glp [Dermatophilaceae bacterium]
MITVQEHLSRIVESVQRLPPIGLDLLEAQGCVLAQDVTSEVSLPGFRNSAMDGYAVHAADLAAAGDAAPVVLPVAGDIAAGNTQTLSLAPGQSMRIMTGAPMPDGADAVVPVELTDGGLTTVTVSASVFAGQHVREAGEDVQAGDVVMSQGTRLGPRQIALLAAVGTGEVRVTPRPRVVVISTGDELIEPGTRPGFGQVVDSNGLMLTAAVRALDCIPFRVGCVPDDAQTFLSTIESQLRRADAVITTGGVSMGAYDTVKEVLSAVGTMRFDKVAMQPGMPQGFGVIGEGEIPVFTLPGNPVSALVSFEVFVAPALRLMAGRPQHETSMVSAVAAHDWAVPAGKVQYARVLLSHESSHEGLRHTAAIAGFQGSHALGSLAVANALAVIPAEVTSVRAGDQVSCHPLGPILEAS